MMNKKMQEFTSQLFSLTDQSVDLRKQARRLAALSVWLLLSLAAFLLSIFFVTDNLHRAIVFGMSFIKYIPLLFIVYHLAKRAAGMYLDDIYELNDETLAADFLEEVIFGDGRDFITIREGEIPEEDERSPIILIGGPGTLQVNLDNVALLERVDGRPEIIYPRNEPWKLGRFERIREIGKYDEVGQREYAIINLRDQFLSGLSVKSRTKDGIPIEAQGIKIMFSILRKSGAKGDHDENDAYHFDENAVQALVYHQTIITPEPSTPSRISFPWDTTVVPLVLSELENLITSNTLSEILATVSQKEIDQTSDNEATIAHMRMEMTGVQPAVHPGAKTRPPSFQSRSKITAHFFTSAFKTKAAELGVEVEWIDVGTWQLPNNMIHDKHLGARNLARENEKKRMEVERAKNQHELDELIRLVHSTIFNNYEKATSSFPAARNRLNSRDEAEIEKIAEARPDLINTTEARKFMQNQGSDKKNSHQTALEILKSFRKELLAGYESILKDPRHAFEKKPELERIQKALREISQLTFNQTKNPS